MEIRYRAIGVVHSPFDRLEGMPIQPTSEACAPGVIEVFPEFVEGLQDLEGFSHVIVLYHLHRVRGWKPKVTPFLEDRERGVFATRAPTRPNPIGLSVLELEKIEGGRLHLVKVDILDGAPVLDLKPFVPQFDVPDGARAGWFEGLRQDIRTTTSDQRFSEPSEDP